jgi:hypothetical protein
MSDKNLKPPITMPCAECQAKAKQDGDVFCKENQCGSILITIENAQSWLTYSPMEREAWKFVTAMLRVGQVTVTLPGPAANQPAEKQTQTHD